MDDRLVTDLLADVTVVTVTPPPPPDGATLASVERIWADALAATPSLFNGRVFSADTIAPDRIVGHWTEYRFALARMRHPDLAPALGLSPLAVTGLLRSADGVVVGRRSMDAVYQPGRWQCTPAGSVEARTGEAPVDLAAQLAAELEEELGLVPSSAEIGTPVAAVRHAESGIVDVALPIRTHLSIDQVRRRHARSGNREYDEIIAVADEEIAGWLESTADAVMPAAALLLRRYAVRPRTATGSPC